MAVGCAVLKHRLYDVEIVFNRALVYAPLTAALAVIYAGSVASMRAFVRAHSGQHSALAVVASTLVIAALFEPSRRRVRAFVDRRFYRRKYDARKTLESLNARLRGQTDLEALSSDVVGAATRTM